MSKKNMINSTLKGFDKVKSVASILGAGQIIAPIVKEIWNEAKDRVCVPNVCRKECPLKLEDAIKMIKSSNLDPITTEAPLSDASPKYAKCFEFQVIYTDPKGGFPVKQGKGIIVKYITQDVIDESKRLLEIQEKEKQQKKLKREEIQTIRKKKTKQIINNTIDTAKKEVKKIPVPLHKKKDSKIANE